MTREIWELQEPMTTLGEIDALCSLEIGRTVVAAVRLSDQAVTGARVALERGQSLPEYPGSSQLARGIAHELVPERGPWTPENAGITHVLVTAVCREGFVLPGRQEFGWMNAWRYSNHWRAAVDGDVYTVTPHGWTGLMDERAGYEPSLSPLGHHGTAVGAG